MKLEKNEVFHTPKNIKELMDWCTNQSTGPERIAAITAAGMAWNLAAKLSKQRKESK